MWEEVRRTIIELYELLMISDPEAKYLNSVSYFRLR